MSKLRLIVSDEEIREAKIQIKNYLLKIFQDTENLDEKKNEFWEKIVSASWSCSIMRKVFQREGYTDALFDFENQLVADVMSEMGYDVTDGFC